MNFKKTELLKKILTMCYNTGLTHSVVYSKDESCFELVVKKNNHNLLFKMSHDISNIDKGHIDDLSKISSNLPASPIIVGEETKGETIQEGLVYDRKSIPAISLKTLHSLLVKQITPFVSVKRGGFFVNIKGDKIHEERINKKLSLKEVAIKAGVSRRTIYEYEQGNMDASLNTVIKLSKFIESDFIEEIDLYKWENRSKQDEVNKPFEPIEKVLDEKIKQIGLKANYTKGAPFNAIISIGPNKRVLLVGTGKSEITENDKIWSLGDISNVLDVPSIFIVEDIEEPKTINKYGVRIVNVDDLNTVLNKKQFKIKITDSS
ncbi:MAG: helix-turn-helix domain-containing protein [Candidatus Ranarchaeia archaeon]